MFVLLQTNTEGHSCKQVQVSISTRYAYVCLNQFKDCTSLIIELQLKVNQSAEGAGGLGIIRGNKVGESE